MTEQHAKGWPYPIRDVGESWAYGCPRCGVIQPGWAGEDSAGKAYERHLVEEHDAITDPDDDPNLWDGKALYGEDGTPLIGNWPLHLCEQHAREADHADAPYNSHLLAALRAIDLLRADLEGWKVLHVQAVEAKKQGHSRSMEILIENREVYYRFRDHVQRIADEALAARGDWEGTGPAPWQIGERLTEALNRAPGRHV